MRFWIQEFKYSVRPGGLESRWSRVNLISLASHVTKLSGHTPPPLLSHGLYVLPREHTILT